VKEIFALFEMLCSADWYLSQINPVHATPSHFLQAPQHPVLEHWASRGKMGFNSAFNPYPANVENVVSS